MTSIAHQRGGGSIDRPQSSSLADVLNIILDKGLVIDAYVRVSLVGIEILTIDARVVIASVDTYLRFAEATNRLDLYQHGKDLPEVMEGLNRGGAKGKTSGLLSGVKDALTGSDDDRERRAEERPRQKLASRPESSKSE
ncbi:gas vesicle protein GvpJ [Arthrobacter sp. GCM10027362]|uniref:gas vesicle protein GvpJ n=1 Tax=Arthrobacter sp. GCM10027362 TaxID=3273379 RepID=UPI00362C8A9D